MMRVINSGVASWLPWAVTNGEALSVRSKPIERRIKVALLRTVFSLVSESKTFLRNQTPIWPNGPFLHCCAIVGLCD